MSITKCVNCGRTTNSATSNYFSNTEMDGKTKKEICIVTRCYAAFVNGKWVKGCAYDDIDPMRKSMVDHLILSKGV